MLFLPTRLQAVASYIADCDESIPIQPCGVIVGSVCPAHAALVICMIMICREDLLISQPLVETPSAPSPPTTASASMQQQQQQYTHASSKQHRHSDSSSSSRDSQHSHQQHHPLQSPQSGCLKDSSSSSTCSSSDSAGLQHSVTAAAAAAAADVSSDGDCFDEEWAGSSSSEDGSDAFSDVGDPAVTEVCYMTCYHKLLHPICNIASIAQHNACIVSPA